MLRRPPTVISLTENDLQFHLPRIFARSLPVNIDQLSLEDTDEKCVDQDPPFGDQRSSNDDSTSQLNPHRPLHRANEGSSCMTRASLTEARTHSAALPASTMNGSTHRTIVDPNGAPTIAATTAQLISSNLPQTRASRLREPSPSLSPSHPRTELTIPPQEFLDPHILPSPDRKKENRPRSHSQDAWTTLNKHESRVSAAQSFRLPPSASPELTIDLVPQRDPALASTESYEAGLAATKVSPAMANTN
ncbi:hypothetical protein PMG11_02328 [Penicillium brasilianum]|uniref:Uncharacterized protein n=1 Tax=Penicillium brasilianum TaxID=104259 RepID=A0A0F7THV3_PENBI|nr:hypothetical protein PMG11_02328 [Penicillium brasilianum]